MKRVLLLLIASVWAFAQDGITVSASRNVILAPDEMDIYLAVAVNTGTSLDQVVQALPGVGVTGQNLTGISSFTNTDYSTQPATVSTQLAYQFAFSVSYAKTKDLVDKLASARKTLQANGQDLQYGMQASASQSAIDDARQQAVPDLIAQASKRAQFLASAAQLKLGAIASLSDFSYGSGSGSPSLYLNGAWFNSTSLSSGTTGASGVNIQFSVNVRFKLQ